MTQAVDAVDADTVPSPCVNVCKIDQVTGWCEGCMRSLEQIASWSAYSAAEKRAVLALLPARNKTP